MGCAIFQHRPHLLPLPSAPHRLPTSSFRPWLDLWSLFRAPRGPSAYSCVGAFLHKMCGCPQTFETSEGWLALLAKALLPVRRW